MNKSKDGDSLRMGKRAVILLLAVAVTQPAPSQQALLYAGPQREAFLVFSGILDFQDQGSQA